MYHYDLKKKKCTTDKFTRDHPLVLPPVMVGLGLGLLGLDRAQRRGTVLIGLPVIDAHAGGVVGKVPHVKLLLRLRESLTV